jgi:hypothetical protein
MGIPPDYGFKQLLFSPAAISSRLQHGGVIVAMVAMALLVPLIGCSSSSTEQPGHQSVLGGNVATGVILIDVLESGRPEYYWQYELEPSTGLIRKIKEEKFQDYAHEDIPHVFLEPTGAIQSCAKRPETTSLDGKYLARCVGPEVGLHVVDTKTGETVYQRTPTEWRGIRGFAWSPRSHSVAILNISSYYGKDPIERLSALAGHPVPHDTILLDVLDVGTWKVTEYMIQTDVPYSFTRILSWSQ